MSGEAPRPNAATEILLRSRQAGRALAGAAAQHAVAAVMLIGAGLESLDSGHSAWWFVAATIIVGAALVVAVIREIRALRRHGVEPDALPVVDFLAVPLLVLEAFHRHEQGKHYIPWAYVLVALLTLARALAWRRLVRIRRLRLDGTGLDLRLRPWHRVRVAWADVVAVERVARGLSLAVRGQGERVVPLDDLLNRVEVEEAILIGYRAEVARRDEAAPAAAPSPGTPPPMAG